MRVFISHAYQDVEIARALAEALSQHGLEPWLADDCIAPGENYARVLADGLESSQAMAAVLTPWSVSAANIKNELSFALAHRAYTRRVFPILIGPPGSVAMGKLPWILEKYPMLQIEDPAKIAQAAAGIAEALSVAAAA